MYTEGPLKRDNVAENLAMLLNREMISCSQRNLGQV